MSVEETLLMNLINNARQYPLETAISLGMDADKILADLPEIRDILINGMDPLTFEPLLYSTAKSHNRDMLENNYYSKTSPDGRTYEDRIADSGFRSPFTGEIISMLSFNNFLSAEKAVGILFDQIFRAELNPERTEKRNILDPDMEFVGISMESGSLDFGGSKRNVYLPVCDFASGEPDTALVEKYLFRYINEKRYQPAENEGSPLPPYSLNEKVSAAAAAHAEDMTTRLFYHRFTPEGLSPLDRVTANSCRAEEVKEILGVIVIEKVLSASEIVANLYESVVQYDDNILVSDSDFHEIGIGVDTLVLKWEGRRVLLCILVIDLVRAEEDKYFVLGNIYRGKQQSAEFLYQKGYISGHGGSVSCGISSCLPPDTGEKSGISGLRLRNVSLGAAENSNETVSDITGAYQIPLPVGLEAMILENAEGRIIGKYFFSGGKRNQFFDIYVCED